MSKITGKDGEAVFNSNTLHITGWEKTESDSIIDTTDSGNTGWREKTNKGIKDWKATVKGHFDTTDTLPSAGDSATLTLTRASGSTISGTAFVSSINESLEVEGESVMEYTIEFEGSGALS